MSNETDGAIRVFWPEGEQRSYDGPCPNCGAVGAKIHCLDVAWTAPKLPEGDRKPVFACPDCDARFYPPLDVPNYHDVDVMDWGWHQFHIQQGAGLVPITDPLGRINRPAATRFLEIGCGYGFGLDFAIHALGWQGMGIDPSPMSRVGADDLGITIRDGYFPQADPESLAWDVIAATEVIEHVQSPADLLAALRARLAPDGILLLTTPDGAAIDRATPEPALIQLLAPGIHMVFQTEASLRRLFDEAGFGAAQIHRDGLTLVAYAGLTEGALADDKPHQRARFRAYLAARARDVALTTDLGLGFAGRTMFEAAVDQDWDEVAAARGLLWPAIAARFGIDLDDIASLPGQLAARGVKTLSLAALKDAMPLNLGMILYAEASRLRADGARRGEAATHFILAGEAAGALHAALARLTLNDGLAEELRWRGVAEAAIEAARIGSPETLARFATLRGLALPEAEHRRIAWRGVIELTNEGAIDLARQLRAAEHLKVPGSDLPAPLRRDAMIICGQLALEPGGDLLEAVAMADLMGDNDLQADNLRLGAFIRLVNRSRYHEAAALAAPILKLVVTRDDAVGRDASEALTITFEKTADPAAIAALLRPLRIDPARRDAILLEAFGRLVNESRYEDAIAMADAENIVSRAVARGDDDTGRNARFALALLDLTTGDPMDVPARLATIDVAPEISRKLLVSAFSRLVNAARYREAADFAAAQEIEAFSGTPDEVGTDAAIGLAILDLVTGDPAEAPTRIADSAIDTGRRRQITLGAFVTLVNRARYDDAQGLLDTAPIVAWAADPLDQDGADASIALIALALVTADPASVPPLLDRLPNLSDAAREDAIGQAALRLLHLDRAAEAQPLMATLDLAKLDPASRIDMNLAYAQAALDEGDVPSLASLLDALDADGVAPARIKPLVAIGFTGAVNRGDFAAATLLRHWIEPDFMNFAHATTDTLRSAGFALGVLDLQEPAQPHRAEEAFAAVRRGYAGELTAGGTAPTLFWEALRGEIIALHRTDRAEEATALGRAMLARYRGAPDDLAGELTPGVSS